MRVVGFKNVIEAALCYDFLSLKYYAEFAHLNFPMLRPYFDLNYDCSYWNINSKHSGDIRLSGNHKSRFVGSQFMKNKLSNQWRSVIVYQSKKIHLGYYNTQLEAVIAYDDKALEIYGKEAKLNFPLRSWQIITI